MSCPPGFKRVSVDNTAGCWCLVPGAWRLAPGANTERLARARRLLAMPAANPQAREDAQAFMRRAPAIDVGVGVGPSFVLRPCLPRVPPPSSGSQGFLARGRGAIILAG